MVYLSKSRKHQLVLSLVFMFAWSIFGSQSSGQKKPDADGPVYHDYRGVQIGMTADEARKILGSPKDKSDAQDFYVFSEKEAAQVVYDGTHKVVTVSVDFMSGASGVPAAKAVLGVDVETKPDGSAYKLVRYPKAGYWVSYSKTAGDSPMISVTIQKLP